jgi:hypothetical protein
MKRVIGAMAAGAIFLAAPSSDAFCGFYVSGADAKLFNDATQVALMREGTRTVLAMQNDYQGPPESFAMVVPVPVILQKENVKTLPRALFEHLDQLDAPRLVEYWEQDPCAPTPPPSPMSARGGGGALRKSASPAAEAKDLGVTVEAQFTVGEYEIVILSAKDSTGLDTWLKQEKYKIPDGSEPYLRPYVQSGSKFFVARVDTSKVTFDAKGHAALSPLRFHYDSETFNLPVRLGLVNSKGTQDLIVHVLAKGQRYELANYPNVTIPTNLDVAENAKESFGSFYAALFDKTLEKNKKAVVTEYSWDAGTCDPCPGPALTPGEIASLGGDVLPSAKPAPDLGNQMKPSLTRPGRPTFRPNVFSGFVITRLHARYSKESLGEDLVFKAAPPIVGGRESRSANGEIEHGSTASSVNNFQGRYAIRHAWGGPITCKEPRRGVWGGPPGAGYGFQPPKPATNTAFAPRDVALPSFVRSEIPELGVKGEGAAPAPAMPAPKNAMTATPTAGATSDPLRDPAPDGGDGASAKKAGCSGCVIAEKQPRNGLLALAATTLGLASMFVRRRRRAS